MPGSARFAPYSAKDARRQYKYGTLTMNGLRTVSLVYLEYSTVHLLLHRASGRIFNYRICCFKCCHSTILSGYRFHLDGINSGHQQCSSVGEHLIVVQAGSGEKVAPETSAEQ